MSSAPQAMPDAQGRFGPYGGRYVPETLVAPLEELERAYTEARDDPKFQSELDLLLHNFAGRPTPLAICFAAQRTSWRASDLLEARRSAAHGRAQN